MQIKFDSQSQRIKGLCFHPIRPWILSSLHNGQVQLWDYRIKSLIEVFNAHDEPCRGLDFHISQPLFVTGGDDFLIKVWNYKTKKHQFTLKGHFDYVRSTFFHKELPWILSSSDDQTIRIWNYQSRNQIAILTGHSHYVMCAQFHDKEDLIVSCSLDQTLRLWDFSAIKNKSKKSQSSSQQQEIYGTEVEVVQVMEGHDRGVNWCAFHPEQNLIISAADDRKVKIWKFNNSRAWEDSSLYGHNSNVSCCLYHPKEDVIISNSEDKSIRVWNSDTKTQQGIHKRESDRYWVLTAHPENAYFAAGHDSGFEIISLKASKIPNVNYDSNSLVFVNGDQLNFYDYRTKKKQKLQQMGGSSSSSKSSYSANNLIFNQHGNPTPQFLISEYDKSNKTNNYTLLTFSTSDLVNAQINTRTFRAKSTIFVTKTKLALIKDGQQVEILNTALDSCNPVKDLNNVDEIYPSPVGKVLAKTSDSLVLYDINGSKIVQQVPLSSDLKKIKYVIWSKSQALLAFVCKKNILIYTKNLEKVCSFYEKFNVKSLIWGKDNCSVFYTTINHIKFGLLNGDSGVFKCVDSTLRITKFDRDTATLLNIYGQVTTQRLNIDDYSLRSALQEKNFEKTQKIITDMPKFGNSTVSYLYKKNYAGLALGLVQDKKAQFSLALNYGNLDIAWSAANEIKDKDLYKQFSKEAVRQGQFQHVEGQPSAEMAYRQTKEYEKLMFLYLITGQQQKLQAMIQIAQKRGDHQAKFQNALYTGDVKERIRILSEIGQIQLAYLTAVTHGYTEMADILKQSIDNPEEVLQELKGLKQSALVPPQPLVRDIKVSQQARKNWPLNHIPDEYEVVQKQQNNQQIENLVETQQVQNLIEDDQYEQEEEQKAQEPEQTNFDIKDDEDNDDWEVDEEESAAKQEKPKEKQEEQQNAYRKLPNQIQRIGKLSQNIGQQTAVGQFEAAFQSMKKQLGIVSYGPLKETAMKVYNYSQTCVSQIPYIQSQMNFIQQEVNKPSVFINLKWLSNQLQSNAYKIFSKGPSQFKECFQCFTDILYSIPFAHLQSQDEIKQIKQLTTICLNYMIAIKLMFKTKEQPNRQTELTTYMALCNLQSSHREKTLRQAQSILKKEQNYIYCSYFSKKIMSMFENTDKQSVYNNARDTLRECENIGSNASQLNLEETFLYEDDFIWSLDAFDFTIIEGGSKKCPFCTARYNKQREGQLCNICGIGKIGLEVMGLKI